MPGLEAHSPALPADSFTFALLICNIVYVVNDANKVKIMRGVNKKIQFFHFKKCIGKYSEVDVHDINFLQHTKFLHE